MTRIWKSSGLLGLATLATLGLAAAQSAAAQTLTGFAGFAAANGMIGTTPGTVTTINSDGSLQLTPGVTANVAGSIWSLSQVNIGSWTASFDYVADKGSSANYGDGFSLAFQNAGTTALGGNGNSLGYAGIAGPSAAAQFEIYPGAQSAGPASNSTGFGVTPLGSTAGISKQNFFLPTSLLTSGTVQINLSYSNSTNFLVETFSAGGTAVTQSFYGNLGSVFPGDQAYVGFTGSNAGKDQTKQTISNFTFTGSADPTVLPAPAPIAVTGFSDIGIQDTPGQAVTPIDVPNQATFFTVNDNSSGGGLPANGTIVSTGSSQGGTFQLVPYSGKDALMLSDNAAIATTDKSATYSFKSSGTLTLAAPGRYSTIGVLGASTYNSTPLTATFEYSDGTTTVTAFDTADWATNQVEPAGTYARIGVGTNTTGVGSGGRFLFETYFQTDATKTLDDIVFADTLAGGATQTGKNVAAIYAINGIAAAPEPDELAALTVGAFGLLGLIAKKRRASAA